VLVQSAKVMQQPFYALYVAEVLGGTPAIIGLTYAVSAAGLMLSAPLWGKLFERHPPARTLRVIEQVTWACAGTLAVAAMANQWAPFIASRVLWGVWQGALLPVAYALIATTLPASRQGFALGVGNSAAKAGGLVGIFIGGIGVSVVGLSNSFWMVVVTYAIAALAIRLVRSTHPLTTLSSHSNNNP
jgi:MFS family permease